MAALRLFLLRLLSSYALHVYGRVYFNKQCALSLQLASSVHLDERHGTYIVLNCTGDFLHFNRVLQFKNESNVNVVWRRPESAQNVSFCGIYLCYLELLSNSDSLHLSPAIAFLTPHNRIIYSVHVKIVRKSIVLPEETDYSYHVLISWRGYFYLVSSFIWLARVFKQDGKEVIASRLRRNVAIRGRTRKNEKQELVKLCLYPNGLTTETLSFLDPVELDSIHKCTEKKKQIKIDLFSEVAWME